MIKLKSARRRVLLAACLLALVAGACQATPPKVNPTPASPAGTATALKVAPRVGSLAPDFTVEMLSGESLRLSDLRGKAVLLNFWATWCPPCRLEMPFIQAVYQEGRYPDLVVVAMNRNEDAGAVSEFMEQNGYTFPVALDPGLNVAEQYQVYAVPETFLIDPDGVIRVKKIGAYLTVKELESSLNMVDR